MYLRIKWVSGKSLDDCIPHLCLQPKPKAYNFFQLGLYLWSCSSESDAEMSVMFRQGTDIHCSLGGDIAMILLVQV